MDAEQIIGEIRKVKAAIAILGDGERFSGQDRGLISQMAEEMLTDIETGEGLVELSWYIKRYCNVLDRPDEEAAEIAAEIERGVMQAG